MKVQIVKISKRMAPAILVVVFIYFAISVAQASVVANTVGGFKSLFTRNATTSVAKDNNNLDHVLRVSSKAIVEKSSTGGQATLSAIPSSDTLKVDVGPLRTEMEEEIVENDTINVYEVKKGDSVSDVANIFGVTRNTIIWANDIKNGKLIEGDILIILPVSGVKHIVKKGDTIKSIGKKYKADINDILEFNSIKDVELTIGDELIIPDGQINIDAPIIKAPAKKKIYATSVAGYFTRPILSGIKTQGIHGKNAVDIGAKTGTGVVAAAKGIVQVARSSGYNGGYGKMLIISHPNGTQTLYAHLSKVSVSNGEKVEQGQLIGEVGNTGKSTGPHLHFEVRGATNPF